MNEHIKRNTPALVEQTLANYGAWDVVALLLSSHRLRQTKYEAWRIGEVPCLEDAIIGNTQRIVEILEAALQHALSMQLIMVPHRWGGWGKQSDKTLRLFHDDHLNSRFLVRLSPATDRSQLDLFMDAPHIVLLNRLRQALLNRSPECDTLFERALDEMANEPALARLDTIRAAMSIPSIDNPVVWFAYLNDVIAPAVYDEFPQHSMDIMASLWRDAADAMTDIPYDSDHPNEHASQAFLLAHAWEQCLFSVEHTANWFEQAKLHDRRILALSAMHEHQAERAAWMLYCWCCPGAAVGALSEADLHVCGLHDLWQQFVRLESDPGIECFPALVALKYQSNDDQALMVEYARHTRGRQYYQQIIDLLASEQYGDTDITRRSMLKTSSPWLFQAFMAARN